MEYEARVFDADWRLTEEPSDQLEARLYLAGYTVMWTDGEPLLEGHAVGQGRDHVDLLREIAPISTDMSWVLWWTVAEPSELYLSLAVGGELREVVLPRPPPLRSTIDMVLRWRVQQAAKRRAAREADRNLDAAADVHLSRDGTTYGLDIVRAMSEAGASDRDVIAALVEAHDQLYEELLELEAAHEATRPQGDTEQ